MRVFGPIAQSFFAGGHRPRSCRVHDGTLPPEAENDWVVVSVHWVNPKTDDLDAVFENNDHACKNAILAAMKGLPHRDEVFAAAREVSNPFHTPKRR